MSTPSLPLRTYNPHWATRWEHAYAAFRQWKSVAEARDPADADYWRAVEAMEHAGAAMQIAYEAQFRTVEAYRDWRLKWLWNRLGWPWLNIPRMPDGLTVREVRRRLDDAEKYLSALRIWSPHGPGPGHIRHLHQLLASSPDPVACGVWELLRLIGGDHV